MSGDSASLTYISTTCIVCSIGAIVAAILVIAYRVARPHFPVTVNCWFCNKDSKVPYGNKTCWDCPFCEQYNGFTEDGDYNKAIPAQCKENLNHPVSIENRNSKAYRAKPSALCDACNRNQLLKVRQLANFVPYNDANYDMEVEGYRFHLEQIYRLCRPCQIKVDQVLEEQNKRMEESIGNATFTKHESPDSSLSVLENSLCSSHISCQLSAPWHVKILRWSSLLCAVSLFLVALISLLEHSHSLIEPSQWLPNIFMIYCTALHKSIKLVILLGLVTGLLAIYRFGKHSLHICDAVSCMIWLLTLAVFSDPVTSKLKTEDVFLLQAICTTANVVVCLWGSFCPRFEASNSKRVKRKGKHLNLSGASFRSKSAMSDSHNSTLSEDNERRSVVSAPDMRSKKTVDDEHLEKFETMSLGKPSKKGLRTPGIFTVKNDSLPSQSPMKSTLDSLRQRKVLISPARFKPSVSSSSDSRTTAPRMLFSSSKSQWKGGLFAGLSQSNDVDGNESVFSMPRTNKEDYSEDEEENASQWSRSSYCPVGSTDHEGEGTCQLNDKKTRSIFTRIFIGISLGLNIALVLYFIIDFNNIPSNLENIKDNVANFTTMMYEKSGPLKDSLTSFCKTSYDYGMVVLSRLTQDIPGEGAS